MQRLQQKKAVLQQMERARSQSATPTLAHRPSLLADSRDETDWHQAQPLPAADTSPVANGASNGPASKKSTSQSGTRTQGHGYTETCV